MRQPRSWVIGVWARDKPKVRRLEGAGTILLFFLVLSCFQRSVTAQASSTPESIGFAEGEEIVFECRNFTTGNWTMGPICHQTSRQLSVNVGINKFTYCGLAIHNQSFYNDLVDLIKHDKTWHCRVPMTKERKLFVPFTIPVWGTVEVDHVRVNNRLNFVFHLSGGKIIGATAYPVLDKFQQGKLGGLISLHGAVAWLHHTSFQSEESLELSRGSDLGEDWLVALASGAASSLLTLVFAVSLYVGRLKPNIIRRCLKKE